MASGISVSGLDEVRGKLAVMEEALRRDLIMKATTDASAVMRDEMALLAPELDKTTAHSTALPPRALKEGIRANVRWLAWGYVRAVIGPRRGTGKVAHLVEFGHRLVRGGKSRIGISGDASGPGKVIGEVPAHPFLRPAYEASAQRVLDTLAERIRFYLKEIGQ